RIADGIAPGTQVEQGQVIGYVGTTGLSTGNHLHYEVTVNDRLVDALSVRLPPRKAVMPGEMGNFADVVYSVEQLLEEETPRQLPSPSNRS
ncbi:MAG TPA: peptidase M24, partial [Hyphomonas sp.]|nr:peptidase M24 [Hyphomonas sp.]